MTRTNTGRDALPRVRTVLCAFLANADAQERVPPHVQLPNLGLIARKIELGHSMTNFEHKFFGGPRVFMRNILRSIKPKEI